MRSAAWTLGLGALLLAAPSAFCDQLDLGGGDELFALVQRPAGARALALGSAFEAVGDDPSTVLWNPASPALAKGLGLSMHHETWLASTDREVLSAQAPLNGWLGLGLFGSLVSYSGTELRDEAGEAQGYFTPQEQSLGASLSLKLGQAALGLGGRFLRQSLPGQDLSAAAAEAGLLWRASERMRLASVLRMVPKEDGVYQANGSAGFSLNSLPGAWRWMLSSSVRLDPAAASELDAGLELGYNSAVPVAFRVGYSQGFPSLPDDAGQRFSVGAGAAYGNYQLDYAFLPWGDFGPTHRLSLSFAQPWAVPEPVLSAAPTPQPTPIATPVPTPEAVFIPAPVPAPAPLIAPPRSSQTTFRVLSDAVVQARGLEAAGRPGEAMKLYHQAATADPNDQAAWQGLAKLYQRSGQGAYARQCWQQVLRLDPSDPDARVALGRP